ncbi:MULTISPECIES: hypothetical protein [Winogradskyella]|uniref:hypothetical protein n=1 Tax=Winogradskyella TaxID=286104 RepID=UPI0015CD9F9F|nr:MULTISPECIES: hypothetical protein [Winogradskyella]QXP78740.1 hypothetical protein H0I32_16285 [Winogradskyella sp. HaHa_3_26]
MTLEYTEKDNTIKTIWNGIDSVTTIKSIIKLTENDNRKLLGYNLYSKAHLETLNKMKSIENMDLEDYKKYLNIYYWNLKLAMTEYEKNIEGYYGEAPKFFYQISISSLLEMNYNPIQTSETMNSLMTKYKDNEEIKEFINTLKEK